MTTNIEERLTKVETDICWIKKMLQKIDSQLSSIKQDLDSTKIRVMTLAGGVSVIISIILDLIMR